MPDYNALQSTATRLISQFGQNATLTKETDGTFDPVLGVDSGRVSTDYTVKAVIMNYDNRFIDNSLIQLGDKKAYISSGTAPEMNDSLTVQDVKHEIVNVKTLSPAGTVVYYEAQVRR